MKNEKSICVKSGLLAGGIILAVLAAAPSAQATAVNIGFNGAGISGHASLTVVTDTPAGDPAGAQLIANANGTFSDGTLSIYNVPITGVLARNFATPFDVLDGAWQPGDVPFPHSFSQFAASGTSSQDNGVITYSDLFYPAGSPQTCWDYPFSGGYLDPYGVMLTLSNGDYVDLWSDGYTPPGFLGPSWPGGLTYGFALMEPNDSPEGYGLTDTAFGGVRLAVPEPDFLWLLGAGVLGLFAWRRSAEAHKRASQRI